MESATIVMPPSTGLSGILLSVTSLSCTGPKVKKLFSYSTEHEVSTAHKNKNNLL